jgi:hypothetical protein
MTSARQQSDERNCRKVEKGGGTIVLSFKCHKTNLARPHAIAAKLEPSLAGFGRIRERDHLINKFRHELPTKQSLLETETKGNSINVATLVHESGQAVHFIKTA